MENTKFWIVIRLSNGIMDVPEGIGHRRFEIFEEAEDFAKRQVGSTNCRHYVFESKTCYDLQRIAKTTFS